MFKELRHVERELRKAVSTINNLHARVSRFASFGDMEKWNRRKAEELKKVRNQIDRSILDLQKLTRATTQPMGGPENALNTLRKAGPSIFKRRKK